MKMELIEARCRKCKELFVPADEDDLIHLVKEDSSECGGEGEILGVYTAPRTEPDLEEILRKVYTDIHDGANAFTTFREAADHHPTYDVFILQEWHRYQRQGDPNSDRVLVWGLIIVTLILACLFAWRLFG